MILVVDNYDSFTYNLVDYFGKISPLEIRVIRNDAIEVDEIAALAPKYIVISPGPKSPSEAGISEDVIRKYGATIPLLGVCLGHQAIGEVAGCEIIQAKRLMHGRTSSVRHLGTELFEGIPTPFVATRYHSLVINPKSEFKDKDIEPIAFAEDDGEIMAVRHRHHPIYGVQFHPESICTPDGLQMLKNFLKVTPPAKKP